MGILDGSAPLEKAQGSGGLNVSFASQAIAARFGSKTNISTIGKRHILATPNI